MVTREQDGGRLTPMEHKLVTYLDGHAGRAVAEWELVDFLFRGVCSGAAVRVHIANIRRKLGRAFIEVCAGGGYRLSSQRAAALARVCVRCGRPVVEYAGGEAVCYGCPGSSHVDLEVGRAAYADGSNSGKRWTAEEVAFAVGHSGDMSFEEIGEALGRGEASIRGLYQGLGLTKRYVRRVVEAGEGEVGR